MDAKGFMRLKMLLKSYSEGYERTAAKTFTKAEILSGLQLAECNPEWTLRKAAISLAFCVGLGCEELRALRWGDLVEEEDGIWVRYNPAKQHGEVKENKFLVPWNMEDWTQCFASRVRAYRVEVVKSIDGIKNEDPLWYRVTKSGYCLLYTSDAADE